MTSSLFTRRDIPYSTKNIPIPKPNTYLKQLIDKTENFLKRLRWRALYFLQDMAASETNRTVLPRTNPSPFRTKHSDKTDSQRDEVSDSDTDDSEQSIKMNYGFKSENTPPPIKELAYFERDVWDLVENIKFTNHRNTFQKTLAKDVKKINNTKEIIMKADKTKNWYNIKTENYLKLK